MLFDFQAWYVISNNNHNALWSVLFSEFHLVEATDSSNPHSIPESFLCDNSNLYLILVPLAILTVKKTLIAVPYSRWTAIRPPFFAWAAIKIKKYSYTRILIYRCLIDAIKQYCSLYPPSLCNGIEISFTMQPTCASWLAASLTTVFTASSVHISKPSVSRPIFLPATPLSSCWQVCFTLVFNLFLMYWSTW